MKIKTFYYAINEILNKLILNNFRYYHIVIFLLKKMILIKIKYKTYNSKLLSIFEFLKTWYCYLQYYKYKIIIFSNHIKLDLFINLKSLSSKEI